MILLISLIAALVLCFIVAVLSALLFTHRYLKIDLANAMRAFEADDTWHELDQIYNRKIVERMYLLATGGLRLVEKSRTLPEFFYEQGRADKLGDLLKASCAGTKYESGKTTLRFRSFSPPAPSLLDLTRL